MARPIPTAVWTCWGLASFLGLVLIALPDSDQRVLTFSRLHGPSAVDAIGIVFLVGAWVVLDLSVWARRKRLLDVGRRRLLTVAVLGVVSAVVIVTSVLTDEGWWWVVGGVVLAGLQIWLAWRVSKPS